MLIRSAAASEGGPARKIRRVEASSSVAVPLYKPSSHGCAMMDLNDRDRRARAKVNAAKLGGRPLTP
jgi:hypothetical protein